MSSSFLHTRYLSSTITWRRKKSYHKALVPLCLCLCSKSKLLVWASRFQPYFVSSEEIESADVSSKEIKFVMLIKLERNSSLIVIFIVARDDCICMCRRPGAGAEKPKYSDSVEIVDRTLQTSSADIAQGCFGEQEQQPWHPHFRAWIVQDDRQDSYFQRFQDMLRSVSVTVTLTEAEDQGALPHSCFVKCGLKPHANDRRQEGPHRSEGHASRPSMNSYVPNLRSDIFLETEPSSSADLISADATAWLLALIHII